MCLPRKYLSNKLFRLSINTHHDSWIIKYIFSNKQRRGNESVLFTRHSFIRMESFNLKIEGSTIPSSYLLCFLKKDFSLPLLKTQRDVKYPFDFKMDLIINGVIATLYVCVCSSIFFLVHLYQRKSQFMDRNKKTKIEKVTADNVIWNRETMCVINCWYRHKNKNPSGKAQVFRELRLYLCDCVWQGELWVHHLEGNCVKSMQKVIKNNKKQENTQKRIRAEK